MSQTDAVQGAIAYHQAGAMAKGHLGHRVLVQSELLGCFSKRSSCYVDGKPRYEGARPELDVATLQLRDKLADLPGGGWNGSNLRSQSTIGKPPQRRCNRDNLNLTPAQLTVSFDRGGAPPARIGFGEQVMATGQGESQTFDLT